MGRLQVPEEQGKPRGGSAGQRAGDGRAAREDESFGAIEPGTKVSGCVELQDRVEARAGDHRRGEARQHKREEGPGHPLEEERAPRPELGFKRGLVPARERKLERCPAVIAGGTTAWSETRLATQASPKPKQSTQADGQLQALHGDLMTSTKCTAFKR